MSTPAISSEFMTNSRRTWRSEAEGTRAQREIEIQAGESGRAPGGHKSSKMATSASEKWAAAIDAVSSRKTASGPLPSPRPDAAAAAAPSPRRLSPPILSPFLAALGRLAAAAHAAPTDEATTRRYWDLAATRTQSIERGRQARKRVRLARRAKLERAVRLERGASTLFSGQI